MKQDQSFSSAVLRAIAPSFRAYRRALSALILIIPLLLTACGVPRISAESRLFLDRSLEFLGEYQLSQSTYDNTPVGALSALTYDRQHDRFYAVSNDSSQQAPARFYTFKLSLDTSDAQAPKIQQLEVEQVTLLKQENGQPYAPNAIAPAGIALSPQQSVFISSDSLDTAGGTPLVGEFDLATGKLRHRLPIPNRYLPSTGTPEAPAGVQEHGAFSALTISAPSVSPANLEPFRIFTATQSALVQDRETENQTANNRLLHYLIGEGPPVLIAEHVYPIKAPPVGAIAPQLTELMVLDQGGHFLSLEETLNDSTPSAEIFQLAMGSATDTSSLASLQGAEGIQPIRKRSLLDLNKLGIPLGDLAGMTLGPQLPDGSQSLLLVSNNHLQAEQPTQVLLFRLKNST
ncbi:esterase-like activity of phytase family protein [Trichocoleus sp. FACHB-262]|uniref:esterase-like activity of phytase family protein n=1 Tax=Trichocoleus sp. FACHB-262 TaxID=2692869 RepID=UPI0018EFAF7D|nr:esterase-like activity of phytase family protein [Trichocoleus sp. FACHB-262]